MYFLKNKEKSQKDKKECPYCNVVLRYLNVSERRFVIKEMNLFIETSKPMYSIGVDGGLDMLEYFCPYCDAFLTDNEEIAIKLLKGEISWEKIKNNQNIEYIR